MMNQIVLIKIISLILVLNSVESENSCFIHCNSTDPVNNEDNFPDSRRICIECYGLTNTTQDLVFYINQTDDTSFNIIKFNHNLIVEALNEFTISGENEEVLYNLSAGNITEKDLFKFNTHFLKFRIHLEEQMGHTNQTRFRLDLNNTEAVFTTTPEEVVDADNAIDKSLSFNYRPNSVHTWILNRTRDKSYGIAITVTQFDLDTDSGDYVLISLGPKVSSSHSKSLVITNPKRVPKYIYFDSTVAYIRVITHASDFSGQRLQMSYIPLNKTYEVNADEGFLNGLRPKALHICVEHRCDDEPYYITLRAVLASYLNKQIFSGNLQLKTLLTNDSIVIFDKEDRTANSGGYCSAQLAVTRYYDFRFTVFDKQTLRQILFNQNDGQLMVGGGQIINDCHPEGILIREIYELIVYFLMPIICVLLILWCINRRKTVSFDKLKLLSSKAPIDPGMISTDSTINNINTRLNIRDFQKLDSDDEFCFKNAKSGRPNSEDNSDERRRQSAPVTAANRRTLDRRTSCSDDYPIIQIKGYNKKRQSILDNSFAQQPLFAAPKASLQQPLTTDKPNNINKSI